MRQLFTIWLFVASATIGMGDCDDSSLVFESYEKTAITGSLSNPAFMANELENDSGADTKELSVDGIDYRLLNETFFSPAIVKQFTKLVRGKRVADWKPRLVLSPETRAALNSVLYALARFSPFRGFDDFYYTVHDVIFRRPGFVTGVLNVAVIVGGPLRMFYPGYAYKIYHYLRKYLYPGYLTEPSTFSNAMLTLEQVGPELPASIIQNLIKPSNNTTNSSTTDGGRIDIAAAEMIALIEANQNMTGEADGMLGLFDAFTSISSKGQQPLNATTTNEKTDKRVGWGKTTRKILKMLWKRRTGFFRKGLKTSTRNATTESNSVSIPDTAVEPDRESMEKKLDIGNGTVSTHVISLNTASQGPAGNEVDDPKTQNISKVNGTDQTTDDTNRDITDTEDVIENVLEALSQVSDNDFINSLVKTYLPVLLERLSENGFTATDLIATVDLSDNADPEDIFTTLKKNQKFVDAMAAVLNVSPEMVNKLGNLQLIFALKNALSTE